MHLSFFPPPYDIQLLLLVRGLEREDLGRIKAKLLVNEPYARIQRLLKDAAGSVGPDRRVAGNGDEVDVIQGCKFSKDSCQLIKERPLINLIQERRARVEGCC